MNLYMKKPGASNDSRLHFLLSVWNLVVRRLSGDTKRFDLSLQRFDSGLKLRRGIVRNVVLQVGDFLDQPVGLGCDLTKLQNKTCNGADSRNKLLRDFSLSAHDFSK